MGFPVGSDGKESACNVGDLGSDLWLGKISWRRAWQPTPVFSGFPGGSDGKESTCNEGDVLQSLGWEDTLGKAILQVFLPGEFHGQRSLAAYSSWGPKELDIIE